MRLTRPKPGFLVLFMMYPGNNPINGKESSSFRMRSMGGSPRALDAEVYVVDETGKRYVEG